MSGISRRNPYVGPRPIQRGEPIYGRSKDIRELYNRLQARRIMVLHSPSGAGKSSLVQAGLVPRLEEGKYDVWRPIRVNLDPHGLEGVSANVNRYLLSAMLSLEEELPAARRRGPAELAKLDFRTYLRTRPRRKRFEGRSVVLLFDQFEEILTVAPRAVETKREFFTTVGQALDEDSYWALFIVREDFLAALAPYRDRIPTQMSVTFRLDFLGLEGAREAAEQPAISGGRSFPAVDQLVRDLSTIQVQQPDGSFVAEQGLYVEPVHLQVVCHRLWERLPEDELSIEEQHIARYAGVSESLGDYYAQAVEKIAAGDPAVERMVREWVGGKLIVEGNRSQVRQESKQSAGLDNELIGQLLSSYLVRTEHRAGANWYELSHDRLVEPIRQNNEAWEREHLHALQVQAKLWVNGKRAPALLLGAEALPSAMEWARQNTAFLTDEERQFLELSREWRAKQRARRRGLAAVAALAAGAALSLGVMLSWALVERREAERAKNVAQTAMRESQRQAAEIAALNVLAMQQLGALEAQTAKDLAETPGKRIRGLTMALTAFSGRSESSAIGNILEDGIFSATQNLHDVYELQGHRANIVEVAFASDGRRLASASRDHTAILWRASAPHEQVATLSGHGDDVIHVEFCPGADDALLTVGRDGAVALWQVAEPGRADMRTLAQTCVASTAGFSPDGQQLAIGCRDGQLCLLSVKDEANKRCVELTERERDKHGVAKLEFAPNGSHLVATHGALASLVDVNTMQAVSLRGHAGSITTMDIAPDGAVIATGSQDGTVKLWSGVSGALVDTLEPEQGELELVAFGVDGSRLVSVGAPTTPTLWQLDGGHSRTILTGHTARISGAAFAPGGELLATVSYDQTLRLWDASSGRAIETFDAPSGLVSVSFSPDGTRLATGDLAGSSGEPMVRVWDVASKTGPVRVENNRAFTSLTISPNGELVAMAEAQRVSVWAARSGELVQELHRPGSAHLSFSASGRELAARVADGWIIWDVETGAEYETTLPKQVTAVAFSTDGAQLAAVDWGDNIRMWTAYADERAGKLDPPPELPPAEPRTNVFARLQFSSTGQLAGARLKGAVKVWDAAGAEILSYENEPNVLLNAIAFSPSGKRLAVATLQKWVWVFDVEDGTLQRLENDNHDVRSVAFSPDETYLVSGSGETVTLWNLELGERVSTVGRHETAILATEWSTDGESVLSGDADGRVVEWVATSRRRRELACEVVSHSPVAYRDALAACE